MSAYVLVEIEVLDQERYETYKQLTSEEALTVWTAYHIDDKQELAFVRPRSQERRQEDESADPVR
jgi:uncharacterized protein (DUF1330 family)